jgi:hypothetical protein
LTSDHESLITTAIQLLIFKELIIVYSQIEWLYIKPRLIYYIYNQCNNLQRGANAYFLPAAAERDAASMALAASLCFHLASFLLCDVRQKYILFFPANNE